jgi:hypothetical protein
MNGENKHFEPQTNEMPPDPLVTEEVMVADVRAGLTPAQMVERKLVSLLKATPLPMSRMQSSNARRAL